MTARRELRLAVLLCLAGALLVLWCASRTWASYELDGGLTIGGLRTTVHGSAVSRVPQAMAIVGITGVLALAATRGWGRAVVGLLLLLAGVAVVVSAADFLTADIVMGIADGDRFTACNDAAACGSIDRHVLWAWLTVVGGVLVGAAGLLVALRGRRWAALSASYQPPAARAEPPATDKGVWDALDRGEDPTT